MCERGVHQQADGSAEWVQEDTCVIAAVYGPHQTIARLEHPERAVISVSFQAAVPGIPYRFLAGKMCKGADMTAFTEHCLWLWCSAGYA
jgi:hypothetical protein